MNHAERCQALLKAAEAVGYAFYTNDRGKGDRTLVTETYYLRDE